VRPETINSGNVTDIDWDEGYFKYCNFEGFTFEGAQVSSDVGKYL
jgi:hypothetical protein